MKKWHNREEDGPPINVLCHAFLIKSHKSGRLGVAGKMYPVFTFASFAQCPVRGGFCFCVKIAENNSSVVFVLAVQGQTAEVLPTVCPHSLGLLAGICWKKTKSPLVPLGMRGALVTNDWCIYSMKVASILSGM